MDAFAIDTEIGEAEALVWLQESATNVADAEGALDWLSGIGGGAATGAATGAAGGPWGALIGGVIGGALGALQTAARQKKPRKKSGSATRRLQTAKTAQTTPARSAPKTSPAASGKSGTAPTGPAVTQLVQQVVELLPALIQAFKQRAPGGESWETLIEADPDALETALETVVLDAWNETAVTEERPFAESLPEYLPLLVPLLAEMAPLLASVAQMEAAPPEAWEDEAQADPSWEGWQTPEWDASTLEGEPAAADELNDETFDLATDDAALDETAVYHNGAQ